jgi:hypothetical protein
MPIICCLLRSCQFQSSHGPPFPQVGERQNGGFSSPSSMCPRPRDSRLARSPPISGVRREYGGACLHGARSTEIDEGPGASMPRRSPGLPPSHFHGEPSWGAAVEGEAALTHFRQPPYRRISAAGQLLPEVCMCTNYQLHLHGLLHHLHAAACHD